MLSVLARHLVCPIHERLLGRRTFGYLRELEESQWFCPNDIAALQSRKLLELLRGARDHTPFYRERLAGLDLNRESANLAKHAPNGWNLLQRIPLLDKTTIRSAGDRMLWRGVPGGLFSCDTGGSTGDPLQFHIDRRRQAYDQAARMRSHRWFGVNVGDRELFLWGCPIELTGTDWAKRLRDRLFNHRLLSAFEMGPQTLDTYLDVWDRFKPLCLFGYPSSIALFVEHAKQRRRRLDTRRLAAVFVTGEVCYPHDREQIAGYFGVPVADGYGSREAGFIAHQCPQGNMHITAENVIVEIIRDADPVPIGQSGEIVVTHLDAHAMPFIRYRTGDVGRLKPGRCSCGRGLPMMDIVQGRVTDFLHLPDGTVRHALSIIYPLRTMPGVHRFRVIQHENYDVTIQIVAPRRNGSPTEEGVRRAVRPIIGSELEVKVDFVDHIEPSGSGKYRCVESHVESAAAFDPQEAIGLE